MKIKQLIVDIGGAKQPKNLTPKYQWEVLDVTGSHMFSGHDLNSGKQFPINDNIINAYYCSMTLEHVHPKQVQFVLKEMYRTLVFGGLIRIVVPDIEIGINWYINNPERLTKSDVPYMTSYLPNTRCGYLFSWINSPPPEKTNGRSGHQMMFDYETLRWYLGRVCFRDIEKKKFNICSDVFTGKDIEKYAAWALYVEAVK